MSRQKSDFSLNSNLNLAFLSFGFSVSDKPPLNNNNNNSNNRKIFRSEKSIHFLA